MTHDTRVHENGEFLVPAGLARSLGLQPGDTLALEQDGAALKVSRDDGSHSPLDRLRSAMRGYSVDQFLRERRADWGE